MATETTRPAPRPARRTIVKGAAWAVPVVTVASAAPAMAASPGPIVFSAGQSCRVSNIRQNRFVFRTSLPVGTDVTVTSWVYTPNSDSNVTDFGPVSTAVGAGASMPDLPPNQLVIALDIDSNTQSNLVICFAWDGGSDCVNTGSNSFSGCGSSAPVVSDGPWEGPFDPPIRSWPVPGGGGDSATELEQPATETTVEESDVEAPVTETPAVEEPAVEAPAVEEPAVEAPAVEAPRVEEPTVDTAEVTSAPDVSTDESTENN